MNEHILIIEDEAAIRSILVELLTDAGYKVTTAGDGLEGIAKFYERSYGLVLLDIMIPRLDGFAVCRLIRSVSDVPVIILTALDEEQAQIKAFELKADDYITKPFSLTLVLLRIEAVLRRSKTEETPKYSWGDIRLDPVSREVFSGGIPVALTHIEFDLLELFLRNPNRVFTRDNLLNQVWGYDHVGDEKTVNIHIMNLRRKLGQALIDTIRGVGYRLGKENSR